MGRSIGRYMVLASRLYCRYARASLHSFGTNMSTTILFSVFMADLAIGVLMYYAFNFIH